MQDMLAMMFTKMNESDWANNQSPVYKWNIDELHYWLGINKNQMAAVLRKPSAALSKVSAGFEESNGDFTVQRCVLLKGNAYDDPK